MVSRIATATVLLLIGCVVHKYHRQIAQLFNRKAKCVLLLAVGFGLAILNTSGVNLRYGYYGNPMMFFGSACMTTLGFLLLLQPFFIM